MQIFSFFIVLTSRGAFKPNPMVKLLIVVENKKDWSSYYPSTDLITVEDYLTQSGEYDASQTQVINLCRNFKYLNNGYYCSLLAEARGHKVMPSVKTINDLSRKQLYGLALDDLNKTLDKVLKKQSETPTDSYSFTLCFGKTQLDSFENLARQIFEMFPCPILRVELRRESSWMIDSIRAESIHHLTEEDEDLFAVSMDSFSKKVWRRPRSRKHSRYDLAILVNPEEKLPPSNKRAITRFMRQGKKIGIEVDLISPKDYIRIPEYDALFIRETTAISDHTYRFAKKAETEGMVVIDDPVSIMRCTNKVYLADLLRLNNVATPKSCIMSRDRRESREQAIEELGFPLVLKIPDGSFSRGVHKVNNEDEFIAVSRELFKRSSLLLAQEYLYTDYDWRIGVLNKKPLFACRYFMTKGHWQIYNHKQSGKVQTGKYETMPVYEAPKAVVKMAVKAAELIGDSLYGVDVKQKDSKAYVIEVNDNPNIDNGVEDQFLGDELYQIVMEEFFRRLERKRNGK